MAMDREKAYVLWFDELRRADVALVGGKSSSLGELTSQTDVPVPYGFATTAAGYRHFMHETGMDVKIPELLKGLTDVEDAVQLRDVTAKIRQAICDAQMPADLAEEIRKSYEELGRKVGEAQLCRRSFQCHCRRLARCQLRRPAGHVPQCPRGRYGHPEVKECYASTFTDRATYYRTKQGLTICPLL